jgi:hypothetical protein
MDWWSERGIRRWETEKRESARRRIGESEKRESEKRRIGEREKKESEERGGRNG